MKQKEIFTVDTDGGMRLDIYLTHKIPEHSRSFFQRLIKAGKVLIRGAPCYSSSKVKQNDTVSVEYSDDGRILEPDEHIKLDIIHEDADLIVINKSPGMVVHPAAGNLTGTVANALAAHKGFKNFKNPREPLRPGIVHRLDKYTSGIMVVAKNEKTHNFLAKQFVTRTVRKLYLAIVQGTVKDQEAVIDVPIDRDIHNRQKMSVHLIGRKAETYVKLRKTYGLYSLIEVRPLTGRTHQIRVHLAYYGTPVVGDTVYGDAQKDICIKGTQVPRQMLHAWKLEFKHPRTVKPVLYTAPVPEDFRKIWEAIAGKKQDDV